jgi:hypothetical protein
LLQLEECHAVRIAGALERRQSGQQRNYIHHSRNLE